MKKLWAILCVVGFTAFWTYGLAITAALIGDRLFNPLELVASLIGLGLGLYARKKILAFVPTMHGRRAKARVRLEQEYVESTLQR